MIEFAPTLGEDALIGRAPVRPRGRSSSSSTNNHRISSKQQRSSSITNSPDPSIITSDAVEPTAAGSRGAPATRRRLSVTRRPPRRTSTLFPLSLPPYLPTPGRLFGHIDCVSPIRPLCGIYKSAPRWRKSASDGSKTSCALPHRSRGQVSVGFY